MLALCRIFLIGLLLSLAVLAGPLLALSAQVSKPDPQHVYLLLHPPLSTDKQLILQSLDAYEVGVTRAPFAAFVQAMPPDHTALVQAGYWLLAGSSLAALCGVRIGAT